MVKKCYLTFPNTEWMGTFKREDSFSMSAIRVVSPWDVGASVLIIEIDAYSLNSFLFLSAFIIFSTI